MGAVETRRDRDEDAGGVPRPALGRALTIAVLAALAPGLGHLLAGRRRVGAMVLGCFATLVAASGYAAAAHQRELRLLALQPDRLTAVMVAVGLVGLAWVATVAHAYALVRPRGGSRLPRVAGAALTGVLCLVVAAPFGEVTRYAYLTRDVVTHLFPAPRVGGAPDPASSSADPWGGRQRLTILLLGGDAADDRYGVRTDSMTLASVDVTDGSTVLLSLPRNLEGAPLPPGPARHRFPNGFPDLLNAVYQYGVEHPDLAPAGADPGAALLKATFTQILGIPVDYYVLIDMRGFRDLINAVGGLWLEVDEPVPYGLSGGVIAPGYRKLDGDQVLWYGRSRTGADDYVRMRRQRCVLEALARQVDPMTVLRDFDRLAAATKSTLSTDLPQDLLPRLVDLADRGRETPIMSLQFVPPLIKPWDPDWGKIRRLTQAAVSPDQASVSAALTRPSQPPQRRPATAEPTAMPSTDPTDPAIGGGSAMPQPLTASCSR